MVDLPRQVDVLIAGAGPAGSATAALLARSGYSALAVDRAAFPRDKACSEYMSPEAVRVLCRLGVVEPLEAAGAVALEGMKVTGPWGATLHGRFALAAHLPFRSTGLSVSRRILDHELVSSARAAGAMVAERTAIEELIYRGGAIAGAVVRDRAGQRHPVQARLTIGADGLRSMVARRIGRRTHGRPRRVAFVAHVGGVEGMGASAELHFGRTGYLGLNAIGHGSTNVTLVLPAARAAPARGRAEQFFSEALTQFPGVRDRLKGAQIHGPVLATGPFAAWSSRVVAAGGLLVGDAADFFDPCTGDGIYSALRGAELVAETAISALSRPGPVSADRLMSYGRMRRRVFGGKWAVERMIGYAMHFPRFFERSVARLGRRNGMAHTLIGVAGGFVPAREVLNPMFLARAVL
ncbi:MAG: NAD(P)/FAD-dependent oxidoreductase [Gemmatimonadales bacterium]